MAKEKFLRTPIIIVNFKTYDESTERNAVKLAKAIEKAAKETKKQVAVAVQAVDIESVAKAVNIPVFAQHVDIEGFGSHTGSVTAEALLEAGAVGTLINHSEHPLPDGVVGEAVLRCKETGLISVVCANTSQKAAKLSTFIPNFIAVEPPELIGGRVSVSEAEPEVITRTVEEVMRAGRVPVLCGAGVNSAKDVSRAIELGAKGILLASAVVLSKDPYKKMLELLKAI